MKKSIRLRSKEHSREQNRATSSSRARSSLPVSRTPDALDRGVFLYLFTFDRTRVLVAVAFLDRRNTGRGAGFAHAPSLDRADFRGRRVSDVCVLGIANGLHGSGPRVVQIHGALYQE